jgi:formylglycine-generating enzyme required for sulfatase activity
MFSQGWKPYRDFIVKISSTGAGLYQVEVQGPAGEGKTAFSLPFDEKDLRIFFLELGQTRSVGMRGAIPQPMQPTVDFGSKLFNSVFKEKVRDVYVASRMEGERESFGLRLRLRLVDVPELADLPWEFLYDDPDFLALSHDTPIVRYLDLPKPPRPLAVSLPLRILVTVSSPRELPKLEVVVEKANIQKSLGNLISDKKIELDFTPDAQLSTLQRCLRQAKSQGRPYHAWHFIGHGGFDPHDQAGVLALCDDQGNSSLVNGFQLSTLFNSYLEIRIVLLNACEGARNSRKDPFAGVAAALVERGIPAVIGMQFAFSDQAAIEFSEGFYSSLVDGLPVDAALTEARRSVFFMPNWVEWATPVLLMRSPDGFLFTITPASEPGEAHNIVETGKAEAGVEKQKAALAVQVPASEALVKLESLAAEKSAEAVVAAKPSPEGAKPLLRSISHPVHLEFVCVPAGKFLMGSKDDNPMAGDNEKPQHIVDIPQEFWIGRFPVTNEQFTAFAKATDYHLPRPKSDLQGKEQHPVVQVSWLDAQAFCNWLNETGKDELTAGWVFRLPTEAEWEKAARGEDGRDWPWGNDEPNESNCNFNMQVGYITPVGRYSPQGDSPYGCSDMAGNVWEWTDSLFKPYRYDPRDGREDIKANGARVLRGGSFDYGLRSVRCASRNWYLPYQWLYHVGFRVVVSPSADGL